MHICNEVPSRSCRLNKTIEEGGITENFWIIRSTKPIWPTRPTRPVPAQHPPNRTKSSKRKRLIKPSRFVSVFVDYLVEFDNNNNNTVSDNKIQTSFLVLRRNALYCTKIIIQCRVMMMMTAVLSLVVDDERSVLEMDTESHHTRWHLGDHIIISSSSKLTLH